MVQAAARLCDVLREGLRATWMQEQALGFGGGGVAHQLREAGEVALPWLVISA